MGGDDTKTLPLQGSDAAMFWLMRDHYDKVRERERASFETVDGQKIALYGVRETRCVVDLERAFDYRRRRDLDESDVEYTKRETCLYASASSAREAVEKIKGEFRARDYMELDPCFASPSVSCFIGSSREDQIHMRLEIHTVALERTLVEPADVVKDAFGWGYQGLGVTL